MTALYKLIFDLSVYYTLTGFYLNIFAKVPASSAGFVLLCLMAAVYLLAWHKKLPAWCCRCGFALPVLVLAFRPGLPGVLHMLPGWAYLIWCLERKRFSADYIDFRDKFLWGLRLQLLCLPGWILSANGKTAMLASLAYLLILLAVGICCLRSIRQGTSALRTGLWAGGFLTAGLLLTVVGIPQLLMKGLSWFYEHVIVWIFQAMASVVLLAITWVIQLIADLSRLAPEEKEQLVDMESGTLQGFLGMPEKGNGLQGAMGWFAAIGYIVVGAVILVLLIWLVIRLLGSLDGGKTVTVVYSQTVQNVDSGKNSQRLTRPRDPRGRVRYYYALFLRECKSRGMEVLPGSTEGELTAKCARYFPGADPKDLALVYSPARYWSSQPVTFQQADAAAKAWKRLKKTKYKN